MFVDFGHLYLYANSRSIKHKPQEWNIVAKMLINVSSQNWDHDCKNKPNQTYDDDLPTRHSLTRVALPANYAPVNSFPAS